jgi:hypothetical protein
MIDQALQKLIEFLQNASPLVWHVLVKQVYVEAIAMFAWAIGLIVLCIVFAKVTKYCGKKFAEEKAKDRYDSNEFEYGMSEGFCVTGSVLSGVIAFGCLVTAIQYLVNPEFYAIRYIIESLAGKQ